MHPEATTFDPAEFLILPETGYGVPRFTGPCGCCGAATFDVVRIRRRVVGEDGKAETRILVEVRCPRCRMESDRKDDRREVIGRFDTAAGEMTLDERGAKNGPA